MERLFFFNWKVVYNLYSTKRLFLIVTVDLLLYAIRHNGESKCCKSNYGLKKKKKWCNIIFPSACLSVSLSGELEPVYSRRKTNYKNLFNASETKRTITVGFGRWNYKWPRAKPDKKKKKNELTDLVHSLHGRQPEDGHAVVGRGQSRQQSNGLRYE